MDWFIVLAGVVVVALLGLWLRLRSKSGFRVERFTFEEDDLEQGRAPPAAPRPAADAGAAGTAPPAASALGDTGATAPPPTPAAPAPAGDGVSERAAPPPPTPSPVLAEPSPPPPRPAGEPRAAPAPFAIWRPRPVFLTSTFQDFHAERDHLRRVVFPALEERLRARHQHLVPIDLRWGVETRTVAEEHAKELLILKVCLAEIERSRPFLIGLLGDRYGWTPSPARIAAAAQEMGFAVDPAGKSVTALEIEYGLLADPEQRRRSRFYFREPLA
jgi:hypothetical protein